jgi:hypothetical protein
VASKPTTVVEMLATIVIMLLLIDADALLRPANIPQTSNRRHTSRYQLRMGDEWTYDRKKIRNFSIIGKRRRSDYWRSGISHILPLLTIFLSPFVWLP